MIRPTWLECADVYVLQLAIYEHETIDAVSASRGPRGRALPSHRVRHATMVDNLEGFFASCHCAQGTQHEPGICWGTPPPRVVTCGPPGWGVLNTNIAMLTNMKSATLRESTQQHCENTARKHTATLREQCDEALATLREHATRSATTTKHNTQGVQHNKNNNMLSDENNR